MSDDAQIARLTELAQKVFEARRFGRVMMLTDGGVSVVTEAGGLLAGIATHPRTLEALEAALLVLAEPLYRPGAAPGRGPEMLRLHIAYERGVKRVSELEVRVQELLVDRTAAYDRLDQVKKLVCDVGQSDERIDALRLLLVGRCYQCGEPAAIAREGVLLCYAHHASEGT